MLQPLKMTHKFLILSIKWRLIQKKVGKIVMKQPFRNKFCLRIVAKPIRMKFYQKKVQKNVMRLAKRKIHIMQWHKWR
jgi:hypothetical protein